MPTDMTKILGRSGLKHSGGRVTQEFLKSLQGQRGMKKYREMVDNCAEVGASIYAIRTLASQVEWRVQPADDDNAAQNEAAFVESMLDDMDPGYGIRQHINGDALSSTIYGFALCEPVWKLRKGDTRNPSTRSKYNDGRYGLRRVPLRSQETIAGWDIDGDDLLGAEQITQDGKFYIPREKFALYRTESTANNPEGRSILRSAYLEWYYLTRFREFEAIGVERDASGVPFGTVPVELLGDNPPDGASELIATLEEKMALFKNDEQAFILWPSKFDADGNHTGYDFELLKSAGNKQYDTVAIKSQLRSAILMSVLAQFLMLGQDKAGGSFALASSSTNLFALSLGSILDMIADTFTEQVIWPIMAANKVKRDLWPRLAHGDIETPPLGEIAGYIKALADIGADLSGEEEQRWLKDQAGIPVSAK